MGCYWLSSQFTKSWMHSVICPVKIWFITIKSREIVQEEVWNCNKNLQLLEGLFSCLYLFRFGFVVYFNFFVIILSKFCRAFSHCENVIASAKLQNTQNKNEKIDYFQWQNLSWLNSGESWNSRGFKTYTPSCFTTLPSGDIRWTPNSCSRTHISLSTIFCWNSKKNYLFIWSYLF